MQPRSLFAHSAFQIVVTFAFVCFAISCDDEEKKTLTVSTSQIMVASTAGTSSVTITTNTSWSAVSDQTWCTFSASAGDGDFELSIRYSENETFTPRLATITIQAGHLSQIITVTQEGRSQVLTVLPENLRTSFAAGATAIEVSANVSWNATTIDSWLQVVGGSGALNGTFTVNFAVNNTGQNRNGQVTIQGGALSRSLTVSQAFRPWVVSTLAGGDYGYAEGIGTAARFKSLNGITSDASGNLYVADVSRIRKVTPAGEVSTLFDLTPNGIYSTDGLVLDASGNFYTASDSRIIKITPGGVVSTLAGQNSQGYADGTGATAKFGYITDLAIDAFGTIFVSDWGNKRIRKVSPIGEVTTLAGGAEGSVDGTGSAAGFQQIFGIDIDASNNIYVAGYNDCRIRKITPAGVVTTLAGGICGFADGPSADAKFSDLLDVAVDAVGNIYMSDSVNKRIRKLGTDGKVVTIAGSIYGNVNGVGESAQFGGPRKLVLDNTGNLYVGDTFMVFIIGDIISSHSLSIRKLALQ